jgi:hypothetical protein
MRAGLWVVVLAGCSFQKGAAAGDGGPFGDGVGSGDGSAGGDAPVTSAARKAITIVGSKIPGMVSQFPVWLDVTDAELAAGVRADATDLYVTDASDVALPYEIRSWDHVTGHLQAWFRAPQLPKTTSTVFYLRYGGASAPAQQPAVVFSAYAAVWHLDDPLTGGSPMVADALGVATGTTTNLNASRQVAAKLGGGVDFDGSTMKITFTNMVTGSTSSTISAWVSERSATGMDSIVTLGSAVNNQSRFLYSVYSGNHVGTGLYANDWNDTGTTVQNAGWTLLHWTFNGGDNKSIVYRDGASVGNHTFAGGVNTAGTSGWIGFADAGWGTNWLNGVVDEVRIATTQLSADWVAIEFANQNSPATFYTVGGAMPAP